MKVVQFVEEHNFHADWHFKFWAEKVEKLGQLAVPPVHRNMATFNGSNLCKIRWEKHHAAFVKVVEGSEIYNFPIHYFVHFYSKILRKTRSNVASPT
jgi:hypothetical protein